MYYFNRLVGFVLTKALQIVLWRRHRIEISVESFRISFLGGRVFAKNLVIITRDQTLSILHLNLTWQYWIVGLTRLPLYVMNRKTACGITDAEENARHPTRLTLQLEGVELFLYNRTLAYDNMMDILKEEELKHSQAAKQSTSVNVPLRFKDAGIQRNSAATTDETTSLLGEATGVSEKDLHTHASSSDAQLGLVATTNNSFLAVLLRFLPMSVRIKKGAVVVGNPTTPTVLAVSYQYADALVDIDKCPSVLDKFRLLYNLRLEHFAISMKTNLGYDPSYNTAAQPYDIRRQATTAGLTTLKQRKKYKTWFKFQKSVDEFANKVVRKVTRNRLGRNYSREGLSAHQQWRGLRRYVGDDVDNRLAFSIDTEEEYAKYSLVLDSSSARATYYYDVPGLVPHKNSSLRLFDSELLCEAPPQFGLDVELSMATIHYGPWADKQRIPLQSMLFPTLYRNSKPSEEPFPGTLRTYVGFDVLLEVKDEVIFRIPTREQSKDLAMLKNMQQQQQQRHHANLNPNPTSHQYLHQHFNKDDPQLKDKGQKDEQHAAGPTRSFGWLELKMEAGSKISSHTSFVATREHGWPNRLALEFARPELRSSVNHDVFFTAASHSMTAKVGFPLGWNEKCNWEFNNVSTDARIFFLREHTMLFSDIFTDFASGTTTPYELFRAFHYQFNWKFEGYKLYLNVNDANIVDNPLDFSNNKYLSFQGDDIQIELAIPLYGQLTKSNTIDYKVSTSFFDLVLDTPPWHTTNAFMQQTKLVGKSHFFTINGSYTYFSSVEINTSDHVVIDMTGDYVTLHCFGFVVRYLLAIRENYFGDNVHFVTFEEYSQKNSHRNDAAPGENASSDDEWGDSNSLHTVASDFSYWKIGRTENDIDVLFLFKVRHGLALLPDNIFSSDSHIGLRFDYLDVDIRFTNYYMDMQADISPITGTLVQHADWEDKATINPDVVFDIPLYTEQYFNDPELRIDGLSIHGHRMFGLPPVEPTYYCKWDIAAGWVHIDGHGNFLKALSRVGANLATGYTDLENELIVHVPTLYDVTFFSFQCPGVTMDIRCAATDAQFSSTLSIQLKSILFTMNDLANDRYTSKTSLIIPSIVVDLSNTEDGAERIVAFLQTSLELNNFCQKRRFLEHRRLQQEHVRNNDAPFHRCPFLLYPSERDSVYLDALGCFITSLSLPDVAFPLTKSSYESASDNEVAFEGEFPKNQSSDAESSAASDGLSTFLDSSPNKMKPTINYHTADFCADYEIDPRYEYDNFVLEFSSIQAFVSPRAVQPITNCLYSFQENDMSSLMDSLHLEVLLKLKEYLNPESNVVNIRFVTDEISIKVGDFDVQDPLEVLQSSPKVPVINISISEPSLAMSTKNTRAARDGRTNTTTEMSSALHIKDIMVSISNPSDFVLATSMRLDNVEFWHTSGPDGLVFFNGIDKLELYFSLTQAKWIAAYLLSIYDLVAPSIPRLQDYLMYQKKSMSEMVYLVSKAGQEFHIDFDPSVLTKPAHVLRSCQDHIRFHDSWKVLSKLRHILNQLPDSWHRESHLAITNYKWSAPPTCFQEVLAIFANWRAWEIGNIGEAFIFEHAFHNTRENRDEPDVFAQPVVVKGEYGNLCLNLRDDHKSLIDFIDLQGININLRLKDCDAVTMPNYDGIGLTESIHELKGVMNIASYNSKLTVITLEMVPTALQIRDTVRTKFVNRGKIAEQEITTLRNSMDISVNVVTNMESYHQQMILPYSLVEWRGANLFVTAQVYVLQMADVTPLTVSLKLDSFSLDFWGEDQIMATSLESMSVLLGNYGTRGVGVRFGHIQVAKIFCSVTEENSSLSQTIETILEKDVKYLQGLLRADSNSSHFAKGSSPTFTTIYQEIGKVHMRLGVEQITWSLNVVSPLSLSGKMSSCHMVAHTSEEASYLQSNVAKLETNIKIENASILQIENSQIHSSVKLADVPLLLLAIVVLNVGTAKFFVPNLTSSMSALLDHIDTILKQVEQLKRIATTHSPNEGVPIEHNQNKFAYRVNLDSEYIAISTMIRRSKLVFEVKNYLFGMYNVANTTQKGQALQHRMVPAYGEMQVPSARLLVVDRAIPVGVSNVVDINIILKVLNNLEEQPGLQSLQVESQHFRVCLCPVVLFKVVEHVDLIMRILDRYPNAFKHAAARPQQVEATDATLKLPLEFSSINILSYNFCVGWVFGDSLANYPGIIIGAERFFAVVEETVGKFTMMEAYLSVSKGSESTNFYSSLSEKQNLNRAYLPTMQIIYLIEKGDDGKHLRTQISGDRLDVKFLSDSIAWIECVVQSGTKVQKFFNSRTRRDSVETKPTAAPKMENEVASPALHQSFSSIECFYSFAGADIQLNRLKDEGFSKTSASIFLHTPAVKMATMYKHKKNANSALGERKHTIKCEVLTTPFNNTVYSACVPVILDIAQGVKRMMKHTDSTVDSTNAGAEHAPSESNFGDVLKDIDLHFGLCIEKQTLSLSCEPTAKVEAVVGIGGIHFQINSLLTNPGSLLGIILVDSVSSSLQHVYSREVSGSIAIASVLLTSEIVFGDVINVYSAGSLSKVSGYINAKQFQDLNLFKDIWMPKDLLEEEDTINFDYHMKEVDHTPHERKVSPVASKNLTTRFKEVSTTHAVPWHLTFILTDVSLNVDVGQSLGNFTLTSSKIWAILKKSTDWTQSLKVGFNDISLVLEGRLGGVLEISDVLLSAGISWKAGSVRILDVPLIILSADIGHIQLKSSFDFHIFALANIVKYSIQIFNQQDHEAETINKDHLYITTTFETAEVYITSFAASNVMDIYNAIFRMVQENKFSYKETLKDATRSKSLLHASMSRTLTMELRQNSVKMNANTSRLISKKGEHRHHFATYSAQGASRKLVSKIEVIAGHFLVHVYPSSFDDSKVLVIKLDGAKVNFNESEYDNGIVSELQVQFNGLKVSLSQTDAVLEDFTLTSTVNEFIEHAHRAAGGTIFVFPSFKISMRTFQQHQSKIIEYFYLSSFGGTVGIKWNLGSINFIREMFAIHTKALASRTSYNDLKREEESRALKGGNATSILKQPIAQDKLDEAINATIDKVSDESGYTYQPLATPIIEAPQLKELGNATPPLEWFGLHRDKFPNVTHQIGIVGLQRIIHEIETQYSKVLGKA